VLKDVQELLLAACASADPPEFVRAALASRVAPYTAAERAMLAALDGDGLRLSRLLVQKLRLERLLLGDAAAAAAFAQDAEAFVLRFRRYCEAVPPTAVFPSEEAALFAAFERQRPH
jgi:hypothetical protein